MSDINEKILEIVNRHFSDPVKGPILNEFFKEIQEIGSLDKTILTAHGRVTVLDGSPDGDRSHPSPFEYER